jgi:hypothetical protein
MRKLAVVQIILGILVVLSMVYWGSWLSNGYHVREGLAPDGTTIFQPSLQKPNRALDIWATLYPALGLAILGCGTAQCFRPGSKYLAIGQIVLGALVIAALIWFVGWVECDYGPFMYMTEKYGEIEMKHLPGWEARLVIWKVISFLLGIGVVETAIGQLIKAGKRVTDPSSLRSSGRHFQLNRYHIAYIIQ